MFSCHELEYKCLNKYNINSLIGSPYLGIFIGDLVSSPAAAGDLLDHQLSVNKWEQDSRFKFFQQKKVLPTSFVWRSCSHLLSLLWSKSPSRQATRPTSRRVSITPTALLRLERVSLLSSNDFASTVLWDEERLHVTGHFFHEFLTVYGFQCKGVVYSRETTHSLGVPHKQVLAFIRLQHELGDADACSGVTVEHDGGVRHFGLLSSTCWLRGHHHIQVSSWWKSSI